MSPIKKERNIIQILDCPVCTNCMCPPIRQCANGHSACDDCSKKLMECPTCKSPINNRNTTLEHLYNEMPLSCNFEGCNVLVKGKDLEDHRIICQFKPRKCLFEKCEWNGRMNDMGQHIKLKHTARYHDNNDLGALNVVLNNLVQNFIVILEQNDALYLVKICCDPQLDAVKFFTYEICDSIEQHSYFEIEIVNFNDLDETIFLKSYCLPIAREHDDDSKYFVGCSYKMALDFSTDNKLYYFIRIGNKVSKIVENLIQQENLANEALSSGKCLYSITSNTSYLHNVSYTCYTCKFNSDESICLSCIQTCHDGHQIGTKGISYYYCDCGAGSLKENCSIYESQGSTGTSRKANGRKTTRGIAFFINTL